MPFTLFFSAGRGFDFREAGNIMDMFRNLADQVPFFVITSFFSRMMMFLHPAAEFPAHLIAAVIVAMTIALFLSADQPFFITLFAVLMFFKSAERLPRTRYSR
jgi:hypothetical protein